MSTNWKIKEQDTIGHNNIGKFDAYYLVADNSKLDKYIRLKVGKNCRYFETKKRSGGTDPEIYVRSGTFPEITDTTSVVPQKASTIRFRLHRIWNDTEQLLALVVLLFGLGLLIDASFDIGKTHPYFLTEPDQTSFLMHNSSWFLFFKVTSLLLKISALVVSFWKGLIAAK